MIFRTLNFKIEKHSYSINVENIDAAMGHWGDEKNIEAFLSELENISRDKETFDKSLLLYVAKLIKSNRRVADAKFYKNGEEIIIAMTTEVNKFKEFEPFSRKMQIRFKDLPVNFSIVEILEEDYDKIQSKEIQIPESWELNEKLTSKLQKFKDFL